MRTWLTLLIFISFCGAPDLRAQGSNDVEPLLHLAADSSADLFSRRDAVTALLAHSDAMAMTELTDLLAGTVDNGLLVMVARDLATREAEPPEALASVLVDRLFAGDDVLTVDLAPAVGRYRLDAVSNRLVAIARDDSAEPAARAKAITALSYDPNPRSAELLMNLIDPASPLTVRKAAFDGLARLSGIRTYGEDPALWQKWWEAHRSLKPLDWYMSLTNQMSRRNDVLRRRNQQISDRLLNVQRMLYRATPENERESLLASMLADLDQATRKLALELAAQRFIDQQTFGPALTTALMGGLDDAEPAVRQGAAKLLRGVNAPQIADTMARRLIDGREQDPDVLREYLLMMTDHPRARAVERAAALLLHPKLRDEAAGVLAGAAEQGLLTEPHRQRLHEELRGHLPAEGAPSPQIISLLGYVGDDADWQRIRKWVDDDNDDVKAAAATAWGRSDRPLDLLARRAGDPVIQPIAIAAAERRGRALGTMVSLIEHEPEQPQAKQAWNRALVAIAGRARPEDVLRADEILADGEFPLELREQVLSAALSASLPAAGEAAAATADPAPLVDMLLRRADLRMKAGQPKASLADLNLIQQSGWPVAGDQSGRYQALSMGAKLASEDFTGAFTTAQDVLKQAGESGDDERARAANTVAGLFLDAAERCIAGNQLPQARVIVRQINDMLASVLADPAKARLRRVETQLQEAPLPPAAPADSTPAASTSQAG